MLSYFKIAAVIIVTISSFSLSYPDESITITTYYPSPYGAYNEFSTASNTYLATGSGNVGVGTATPTAKLQVNREGNALENEWGTSHPLTIWGTDQFLGIGVDSTRRVAYLQSIDVGTAPSNIALNPLGGSVGIGTTSPTWGMLQVQGNIVSAKPSDGTNAGVIDWVNLSNGKRWHMAMRAGDADKLQLYHWNGTAWSGPQFNINTDGNVGIGTATPGYNLQVGSTTNDNTIAKIGLVGRGAPLGVFSAENSKWSIRTGDGITSLAKRLIIRDEINSSDKVILDNNWLTINSHLVVNSGTNTNIRIESQADQPNWIVVQRALAGGANVVQGNHPVIISIEGMGSTAGFYGSGSGYIAGAQIHAEVDAAPADNIVPMALLFYTQGSDGSLTEKMRLASSGRVGIGTASPNTNSKLDVAGEIHSSDTTTGFFLGGGCWTDGWARLTTDACGAYHDLAIKSLWAGTPGGQKFDLSEVTPVKKKDRLEQGDTVVIDKENGLRVTRSIKPYDTLVYGIVSSYEQAAMIIGGDRGPEAVNDDNSLPIALIGRVKAKVSAENGPIETGDLLTTSSTPGYLMRCEDLAKCSGAVAGKALEALKKGKGIVKVLVTLQ